MAVDWAGKRQTPQFPPKKKHGLGGGGSGPVPEADRCSPQLCITYCSPELAPTPVCCRAIRPHALCGTAHGLSAENPTRDSSSQRGAGKYPPCPHLLIQTCASMSYNSPARWNPVARLSPVFLFVSPRRERRQCSIETAPCRSSGDDPSTPRCPYFSLDVPCNARLIFHVVGMGEVPRANPFII